MEKSELRDTIMLELKKRITESCVPEYMNKVYREFHQLLIRNYYKAVDAKIDYHRKRVHMNLLLDDKDYKPGKANTYLPLMPSNFYYKDLKEFLLSCLSDDHRSLAFYRGLLKPFCKNKPEFMPA